jgi:hypothetical protein
MLLNCEVDRFILLMQPWGGSAEVHILQRALVGDSDPDICDTAAASLTVHTDGCKSFVITYTS